MAGIGFELRSAVDPESGLLSRAKAWTAACLISSGPWIVTVAVLSYLQVASRWLGAEADHTRFHGLVTWCFAFSLLVVAVLQMPLSRRLADQLWSRQHDRVLPGLVAALALTGTFQVIVGAVFVSFLDLTQIAKLMVVALYLTCTWTWVALIWLGVTRNVSSALVAYGVGAFITVGLTLLPSMAGDLESLLFIFTAGQAMTLLCLLGAIVRGVHPSDERATTLVNGALGFPLLVATGLFYGLGMWVDKFAFWLADGVIIDGPLRHHPLYDSSSFLAYATVIPALAIHLVRMETTFYEDYRSYYDTITGNGTLSMIEDAREAVMGTLRTSVFKLVRVQAWFSFAAIMAAPEILGALGMPPGAVPVFRILCIGAYFHVLFLLTILVLLYFDRQAAALRASVVFCAMNAVLPWIAAHGHPSAYGVGYAVACVVGLLVGFSSLQKDLGRLEYLTMTSSALGR